MGEVYRAHDTKLGRDVALKVLPAAVSQDSEKLARFQREAKVLASLNHHNIAAIYGLEESGSTSALVMELVEGQTLAERIAGSGLKPAPTDDLLLIAKQIVDALEYAHDHGIVHRDLKPANIKINSENQVKVLDFGLAKALAIEDSSASLANSPTISIAATRAGVILGTAAYMSPEQAKGKSVDRRTDIWAFGCVLFEMLTGRQAFEGETVSDILAAVIMRDPDWTLLPTSISASIRKLLHRCLEKDCKQRLQAIGEARLILGGHDDAEVAAGGAGVGPATRPKLLPSLLWAVPGIIIGAIIAGLVFRNASQNTAPHQVQRFNIVLPSGLSLSIPGMVQLALSPDGTNLVFSGVQGGKLQLYQRKISEYDAQPIPGTEGGISPAFSPDGTSVAFIESRPSGETPALKKVSLAGGLVQTLCTGYDYLSESWSADGNIYFTTSHLTGLAKVPAAGGNCEELPEPDKSQGEIGHYVPQLLPGNESLIFNISRGFSLDQADIAALSLKSGKWQTLIQDGTLPQYVPGGLLVFVRAGSLMAVPFDPASLKVTGTPVPVLENLLTASSGLAQFAFSQTGTMAYVTGNTNEAKRKVVLVDRSGKARELTKDPGAYEDLALSPDGRRLAMTVEAAAWNIWIYDIPRSTLTRFTFDHDNRDPLWSSDGKHIAYTSFRDGKYHIYWKLADGSGQEEELASNSDWISADSFSPDGNVLAYNDSSAANGADIGIIPLSGDRRPRPFLQTKFNESFATFSPDGRWLAYESNETGREEVYVKQFPGPGGKWQISNEGGSRPQWSLDGRELFFFYGHKLMVADTQAKFAFTPGTPHLVMGGDYFASGRYYEVMPGAKQFLFIKDLEATQGATQINVVLNWFDDLKRRMGEHSK